MSSTAVKTAPSRIQKKPRQLNLATLIAQGFVDPNRSSSSSPQTSNVINGDCIKNKLDNTNVNNNNSNNNNNVNLPDNNGNINTNLVTNSSASNSKFNELYNDYEAINTQYNDSENVLIGDELAHSIKLLEDLETDVSNGNYDINLINEVCIYLKKYGNILDESLYKDQIDLSFNTLRNISRNNRLDVQSRARLLEVIELRALNWEASQEISEYYQRKITELETNTNNFNQIFPFELANSVSVVADFCSSSTGSLNANEVIKNSGKFTKPTKVPGKNFVKDEFIIRNSDSGKVNTGAKDRLIQITGPNEDSIGRAKNLIEDTIKRNASPVPPEDKHFSSIPICGNSNQLKNYSLDSSFGTVNLNYINNLLNENNLPYTQTIQVGNELIIISSTSSRLSEEAKCLLQIHFNGPQAINSIGFDGSESSDSEIQSTFKNLNGNNLRDRRSEGIKKSSNIVNYQLSKQTSFHALKNTATAPSISKEEENRSIQRSVSQGSFLPGRTSLRYFSDFSREKAIEQNNNHNNIQNIAKQKYQPIVYDKDFLLECSKYPASKRKPFNMDDILANLPDIARKAFNNE